MHTLHFALMVRLTVVNTTCALSNLVAVASLTQDKTGVSCENPDEWVDRVGM